MWRIRLDTVANLLALEVRDADLLLASFYTLNVAPYSLKQLPLPQAQSWWQGLEDTQEGFLFLHGYGDRKVGQHKGIKAIAAETGEVVWEVPELAFYGFSADGLLVYPATAPDSPFQELKLGTGKTLRTGIPQLQAAEEVAHYSNSRFSDTVFPALYLERGIGCSGRINQHTVGRKAIES